MSITEKYAFVRNLLAGLISSIVFVLHVSAWTNPSTQAEFITEAGGGENGFVKADVILPLSFDANQLFYGGFSAKYATDDAWYASLGAGFRHVNSSYNIWGLTLYMDQTETSEQSNFWIFNPGIEWFSGNWDFHLNGFLPIGADGVTLKEYDPVEIRFGDAIEIKGHQLSSATVKKFNVIGQGGNFDLGYTLPALRDTRIALGGYYNEYSNAPTINGAQLDIMVPVTEQLTVHFADSYDNVFYNNVAFSLIFYFDRAKRPLLYNRIYSPNIRHLGALNTGASTRDQVAFKSSKQLKLVFENLWFFSTASNTSFNPAFGGLNCTAERPCSASSFTQSTIDSIDTISKNTMLFFASGNYLVSPGQSDNSVTLNQGQSMSGRTADFKFKPNAAERPVFSGTLGGQGDNLFQNLNISGSGTTQPNGFVANGATNLRLEEILIYDYTSTGTNPPTGINLTNVHDSSLKNIAVRNIYGADGMSGGSGSIATDGTDGQSAQGISIVDSSNIRLDTISISSISGGDGGQGGAGVNGASSNLQANMTAGNGTAGARGGNGGDSTGLIINHSDNITVSHSSIEAVKSGRGGDGGQGGHGGDASTNQGDNSSARGGNGAVGGRGNDSGEAIGVNIIDSSVDFSNVIVDKVSSGAGGNGGAGGNAGSAGVNFSNTPYYTAYGQQIQYQAGTPGEAGSGGYGGTPVGATGVSVNQSTLNYTEGAVTNITSGDGGRGGNGGAGGDTKINDVSQERGSLQLISKPASDGSSGGSGGSGGDAAGFFVDNFATVTIKKVTVNNINASAAGVGGNAGAGGSAIIFQNILYNYESDLSSSFEIQPYNTSATGGGSGGQGSSGAIGGDAQGIRIRSGGQLTVENSIISNINAGDGSAGGSGGPAGVSTIVSNVSNYNTNSNLSAIGGSRGGNGNKGEPGGKADGILVESSNAVISTTLINQVSGGNSGSGGDGGAGGDASINYNYYYHEPDDPSVNDNISTGLGGNGGSGGAGDSSSTSATGVNLSAGSQVTISNSTINQIQAGNGGSGGNGGAGGASGASNNINQKASGVIYLNNAGNGGAGGRAENGGDSYAIFNNSGGVLNRNNVIESHIIGGNGGNGGHGGAQGMATASSNPNFNVVDPGQNGSSGNGGTAGAGGNPNGSAGTPGSS